MFEEEKILREAKETGFTTCEIIDASRLEYDSSFRRFCEMNYCGNYDQNYSCPPACGTPEELKKRAEVFERVLVLQTITPVEDITNDTETKVIKSWHNQLTREFLEKLKLPKGSYLPAMAGPCSFCTPCAKQEGKACKFPEKAASCLSAYCIKAASMAEACGMEYYCEGRVAFFSLVFLQRKSEINEDK